MSANGGLFRGIARRSLVIPLITFIKLYLYGYACRTSGSPKSTITLGLISLPISDICAMKHRSMNLFYTSPYCASGSKSAIKVIYASPKRHSGLQGLSLLVIRIPQS